MTNDPTQYRYHVHIGSESVAMERFSLWRPYGLLKDIFRDQDISQFFESCITGKYTFGEVSTCKKWRSIDAEVIYYAKTMAFEREEDAVIFKLAFG